VAGRGGDSKHTSSSHNVEMRSLTGEHPVTKLDCEFWLRYGHEESTMWNGS